MFAVTFLYLQRLFINLHRHFLCLQCPLRAIVLSSLFSSQLSLELINKMDFITNFLDMQVCSTGTQLLLFIFKMSLQEIGSNITIKAISKWRGVAKGGGRVVVSPIVFILYFYFTFCG